MLHSSVPLAICFIRGRRRQWHPAPALLPGKRHGWRSLVGCSPVSDSSRLHFHFSLSRSTEGNGNPPQCSCLENPRDRGAWWAAVCGVAQSQTRLKRLNSSSSSVSVSIPVSSSSHPPLPLLCPRVLSLHLHLYFCLGNRFICTAFLDSTCMH